MGPIAPRQLIAWRDSSSNLNAKPTWNGSAGRASSLRRASAVGSEAVRIDVNSRDHIHILAFRKRDYVWEPVEEIGAERESAQNYPSQQILGISFLMERSIKQLR